MKKIFRLHGAAGDPSKDVHREIELHIELRAREFEAQGMSKEDAHRAALNAFGNRDAIESEVAGLRNATVNEQRRRNWLAEIRQDIAIGLRGLRRAPAFTMIALLTLGIGIGANTAIFSVVRSVLLRPLPYTNAEQLVQVWSDHRQLGRAEPEWLAPPDFLEWQSTNRTFASMAAFQGWFPDITSNGDPESLTGAVVSGNFFGLLDTKPSLGRLLNVADDNEGVEPAVVITDALWQRRFGSDPLVLGRQLMLNGTPWTVVGVLPKSFRAPLPFAPEIFRTTRRPADNRCGRGCVTWRSIGRLKPNVTLAAAQADLASIAAQEARTYPETNDKVGAWLVPLHEQITGTSKAALFALSGAVAFVLLIGCVNLANLLLARGAARARELGVRAALGAGHLRIIRQLLTENALLAVLGGVFGLALGVVGSRVMSSLVPQSIRDVQEIRVDGGVLLFNVGITIFAALLFGLLPAFQAVRSNLMGALRSGTRETGHRSHVLRSGLVVTQISLAMVLLVGAGLLLRSFLAMQHVDIGFRSEGVAFAPITFPRARYADISRVNVAMEDLITRLRSNSAIKGVELTDLPPLGGGDQDITAIPVGEPPLSDRPPSIWYRSVSPGYLSLMHMRLLEGRPLTAEDRQGRPPVGILNAEAARRFFPGKSAIGKIIATGSAPDSPHITVIGVVASERHDGPNQPYKPEVFLSNAQYPARGVSLVIEPARDLAGATSALRQALHDVDALVPMPVLKPIEEQLGSTVALPRLYATLVSIFATAALLLAVLGVYGVMAFTVTQRQREIGVRIALGAAPSSVLRMILAQASRLGALGVMIGLAAALGLGQLLSALLFGVSPYDIPTLAVVSLVLGAMTLIASWLPARRAMKVDPITAIRDE